MAICVAGSATSPATLVTLPCGTRYLVRDPFQSGRAARAIARARAVPSKKGGAANAELAR